MSRILIAALVVSLWATHAVGGSDSGPIFTGTDCDTCDNQPSGFLDRYGIELSGMLWHSVNTNSRNPTNPPGGVGNLPGGLFLYRNDEYMFNWLGLRASRTANGQSSALDVGGAIHVVYGTDYYTLQSRGLELEGDGTNKWNSDFGAGLIGGLHGIAIPELYGELASNDMTATFGKFFHPLGFSRYEANLNNIGNTRSNSAIYGEFSTVTGLQLAWQASSQLSLLGAIHRGDANWDDNNENLSSYFGFDWRSADEKTELRYAFDVGREDDAGLNDQYVHGIVFQRKIGERLMYLLHNNFGVVDNAAPAGGPARWYGIEQQIGYELNEKIVFGIRYEWFDDIDGSRVAPTPGTGVYHLLDFGGTYRMNDRFWFRPECRWDWYVPDTGVVAPGPFGNGTARDQFIASLSMFAFM